MDELSEVLEELSTAFTEFRASHNSRLDELEKRMNRSRLGSSTDGESLEERKAMQRGVRALIAGNQAQADQHFAEVKGMSVGVDPGGGYLVTPTFSTEMTKVMLETAPFIGLPRTVEILSDVFEEPEDRFEAGADWAGETQARNDTATPDVGTFSCPLHELHAQPKATQKLVDTARIDVVQYLQEKVAEKFAHSEVVAFHTGSGVNRPRGFLGYPTAATSDLTRPWGTIEHLNTGANGAFPASNPGDTLIDLVAKLKPQYRQNATWLMNRPTLALVRKFKDSQGQYLFAPSLVAGQPAALLGYPLVEDEQMPDAATGSLSIAFGNFRKAYTVVRRLGVRFLTDPYTDKPNVRLYAIERVGGGVNNSEAIKLLRFST